MYLEPQRNFYDTHGVFVMRARFMIAAVLFASPAMAQQAPAPKPPAGPEPTSTTASFGDWVLRCQKVENGPVTRVCEVAQSLTVQGQAQPVAQIAMGRASAKERMRLTVVMPVNVSFPSTPRLGLGDKPEQAVTLAWKRCLPMGCFADVELSDDLIKRLRSPVEGPRLSFMDAAGRDLALPFSLSGLPQALDALAKEPLGG